MSADSVNVHKEYIEFIKEIRDDIKEKPLPSNPLSYMNFITDKTGNTGMAITSGAQNPNMAAVATQSAVSTSWTNPVNIAKGMRAIAPEPPKPK